MDENTVFGVALGLAGKPWQVMEVDLDAESGRLDIHPDFLPFSRFAIPTGASPWPSMTPARAPGAPELLPRRVLPARARAAGRWRHQPGVKTVAVPWARPELGFTLMMEAIMVMLARTGMSVAEHAQRLWRVRHHHVDQAHRAMDLKGVRQLTVDETSLRRGHD